MTDTQIYCDVFYSQRENLIIEQIGDQLDKLQKDMSQLHSPCLARLMNTQTDQDMTAGDLLNLEPSKRQAIVAATMYNDALWRLETAYLMLRIGVLNVVYSNLRSCLEILVSAHIVENIDSEAVRFLNGEKIEPAKVEPFIPEEYSKLIVKMKQKLGDWGVHSGIESIRLGILYGPNTFDKMIVGTKTNRKQSLHPDFPKAATTCIRVIGDVFILFFWLMSKGTRYRRTKERR